MIIIKSPEDLKKLKKACKISADVLKYAGQEITAGMSTYELDKLIHEYITAHGAKPSFLGMYGFPASACISVNDEVIHGIPSKKTIIRSGDIVSVDVGAYIDGFHGDTAYTFAVGNVSEEAAQLLKVTKEGLFKGIEQAVPGNRVGDISHAVEEYCSSYGYGIVKNYVGHGVGAKLHESPEVPNFGKAGRGPRLVAGMTIAIEPMINMGRPDIFVDDSNGWTIYTDDRLPSAQREIMVLVTETGHEVLAW